MEMSFRRALIAIALVSLATLMFELLVNKVLSFSTWGNLGYMIIGSAIFGFSVAGVLIALWQPHKRYPLVTLLAPATLVFSASVVLAYLVMNVVPFNFEMLRTAPILEILYFTLWYVSLLAPFAASGFIITLLLISFRDRANRLYAADLAGAGMGCLLVVPLFPLIGAAGEYLVCGAIGALVTLVVAGSERRQLARVGGTLAVLFAALAPFAERTYPVKAHQEKRERQEDLRAGNIKKSLWSSLSKIEVAERSGRSTGMIWFDGGMMQSAIDRFDGDYATARQDPRIRGANSIAYRLRPGGEALIIAPAGGREVRAALAWGAQKVVGVELDSSLVRLVERDFDGYLGGLYSDGRVTLVNDEGRSFVRRSNEEYDVIQFISAYSVAAVYSGAVALHSSYLTTSEAFDDYLAHLSPRGILSISKDMNLRLFVTAWEALERRGLDPGPRIILLRNDADTLGRNTILVSLSPWSEAELAEASSICADSGMQPVYPPELVGLGGTSGTGHVAEPKAQKIVNRFIARGKEGRADFYSQLPYTIAPVSDDRPFFDHFGRLFREMSHFPAFLTEELEDYTSKTWYLPYIPLGVIPNLVVLFEAATFALLLLVFPLWKFKSEGIRTGRQRMALLFFCSLGLGFIWIEIVLVQKFILFLGNPVYSISLVLSTMLFSAGVGSFFSERLEGTVPRLARILSVLCIAAVAFAIVVHPAVFRVCLGLPFGLRLLVAVALIAPIGFVLGMPFPLGLRYLTSEDPDSIPWAWAVNGYTTVVGVSLAQLFVAKTGFFVLLVAAAVTYVLGTAALSTSWKKGLQGS